MVIACLFERENYELSEFNGILSCKCTCRSNSPPLRRKSLPTSHCWVLWKQIPWCRLGARSNCCQCRTEKALSAEGRLESEVCAAATWLSHGQKLPPWERAQAQRTEGMRSERDTAAGRSCCSQTVCPWLFLRRPASPSLLTPVLIITYCRACWWENFWKFTHYTQLFLNMKMSLEYLSADIAFPHLQNHIFQSKQFYFF